MAHYCKNILFYFLLISFLFSCKNQDKKNIVPKVEGDEDEANKWSSQKDCFDNIDNFIPSEEFEWVKLRIYKHKKDSTFHYFTCRYDGLGYLYKLGDNMHVESIVDHGEFWTDKNSVYYQYDISDGIRIFKLDSVDRASFETFGESIYAKDKYHIFDSRNGIIEEADVESFELASNPDSSSFVYYGKDNFNYFFWDEIVTSDVK